MLEEEESDEMESVREDDDDEESREGVGLSGTERPRHWMSNRKREPVSGKTYLAPRGCVLLLLMLNQMHMLVQMKAVHVMRVDVWT